MPEIPAAPGRVLLLRHAETSAPHLFHGAESDVGLGDEGHRQAAEAAEFLAGFGPAAVYCSAMRRARETAKPLARRLAVELRVEPDLHERRMGVLSGLEIAAGRPMIDETWRRWRAGDLSATHPGAESYAEIRDRAAPALERIARLHPGKAVAVVAHGMVIRVLITALVEGFGIDQFDRIPIRHVAVNDLQFDPATSRWRAEAIDLEAARPAQDSR